jgi:hypothetical protein
MVSVHKEIARAEAVLHVEARALVCLVVVNAVVVLIVEAVNAKKCVPNTIKKSLILVV